MWEIYDELIAGIDNELIIHDFNVGSAWSMVRAAGFTGLALTVKERCQSSFYTGNIIGDKLKDVAQCVKSWNFIEASLGMAAINCYYNDPLKVAAWNGSSGFDEGDGSHNDKHDAFNALASAAEGKNVAVIGRFPHLEEQLAPICRLSILERNPEPGDYPDSACEYILAEQDMLFITGMTLTNKTLPRLLQLAKPSARVVMVGPSVPLSPLLYRYGVTDLDGFYVTDANKAEFLIKRGDKTDIFQCGRKVTFCKML
jgi:uncharacterized protein (DUF4213/DUF364 family)